MDFEGDMFTWSNWQEQDEQINERLDRFLTNEAFLQSFPNSSIEHLNWAQSDHRPIILYGPGKITSPITERKIKQVPF